MTEFLEPNVELVEENIREVLINLDELPNELIYKLEEHEFTFSGSRFGFDEWQQVEYYVNRMPKGLFEQFPCLEYMLEDYWHQATRHTPLEEIEYRRNLAENKKE
jgi:hypothetical protein